MERKRHPDQIDKAIIADIQTKSEGDARTFTARITTNSVDRDGEVLLPEGLDASDFDKNPVVFWNHNYDKPIGTATDMKREKDHWVATARLSTNDEAGKIHRLMQEGIVRGVSVGFLPVEHRHPNKRDKELFGDDVKTVFSKWKLLEFSVTPLPANQNALITSVSKMVTKGVLSPVDAKNLCGVDIDVSCAGTQLNEEATTQTPPPKRTVVMFCCEETDRKPVVPMQDRVNRAVMIAVAKRRGKACL